MSGIQKQIGEVVSIDAVIIALNRMRGQESDFFAFDFSKYIGDYQLTVNNHKIMHITSDSNQLTAQASGEAKLTLAPLEKDSYAFKTDVFKLVFDFKQNQDGKMQSFITTRSGDIDCIKVLETSSEVHASIYGFNHPNGFTKADSLRGKLTALRTCYDVLFYDLNVTVDPKTQSIKGNNILRFRTVHSFDRIQIDLFANMKIDKILFRNQELTYTREFNAVFIQFPNLVREGSVEEIFSALCKEIDPYIS